MTIKEWILKLESAEAAPLVALLNYLRIFKSPQRSLTKEDLIDFLLLALKFPHWRTHQNSMITEINAFLKSNGSEISIGEPLQNLHLESIEEAYIVIRNHLKAQNGGCRIRVLADSETDFTAMILREGGELSIRGFNRYFAIYGGALIPVSNGTFAEFDKGLEIAPNRPCLLPKGNNQIIYLTKTNTGFTSIPLNGYTLSPGNRVEMAKLEPQHSAFVALKRVERFFVDRSTDPFYVNLVRNLESANSSLMAGETDIYKYTALYEYARRIVEEIYDNDRILKLLLRELFMLLDNKDHEIKRENDHQTQQIPIPEWRHQPSKG
jgi:hypothetical protein